MNIQLLGRPGTVKQEGSAVHQLLHHVVLAHIGGVVTGHKVGSVNQIGGFNGLMTKAQMAHGDTAGLL